MVGVRIDTEQLRKLEAIGQQIKPKPLNRSEMVNVAIAEYVRSHAAGGTGEARAPRARAKK